MSSRRNAYLQSLDAAWDAHHAPREADAPTVVSTFAGCGGSSLGYSIAGFRELLAVEWDNNAVETFRRNFPDVPVYHGDIAKLSVEDCLARAGISPGELDVFDGSPPCQGFSTAGKRDFGDDRNQLFREFCRLLHGLQPRAFVMENVSGMVKGKMKLIFAEALRELKACGYTVKAWQLNAMWFGVPQSRERMIFIGVRDDLGIVPTCPAATHRVPVTVGEAFAEVGENDAPALTALYQQYWRTTPPGGQLGKQQSVHKLRYDRPSGTLQKSEGNGAPYHPAECRAISTAERKRIASFPDAYAFLSRDSATERIGNCVPPLFMRAIAAHVRALISR
jgi:DNA (cytosine-5)-methyltransferase 1